MHNEVYFPIYFSSDSIKLEYSARLNCSHNGRKYSRICLHNIEIICMNTWLRKCS